MSLCCNSASRVRSFLAHEPTESGPAPPPARPPKAEFASSRPIPQYGPRASGPPDAHPRGCFLRSPLACHLDRRTDGEFQFLPRLAAGRQIDNFEFQYVGPGRHVRHLETEVLEVIVLRRHRFVEFVELFRAVPDCLTRLLPQIPCADKVRAEI